MRPYTPFLHKLRKRKSARLGVRSFFLLEGVIGRAHQRTGFDVLEAHLLAQALVLREFVRVKEALDGRVKIDFEQIAVTGHSGAGGGDAQLLSALLVLRRTPLGQSLQLRDHHLTGQGPSTA